MNRNGIAALLAALYVLGSAFLVASVGKAHRDKLKHARPDVAAVTPVEPSDVPKKSIERASEPPTAPKVETPSKIPTPRPPVEVAATKPMPPPAAPAPVTNPVKPPKPSVPAVARSFPPRELDAFWQQPELTRAWENLDHRSPSQEEILGATLNRVILTFNPEDREPGVKRIRDAARPFLKLLNKNEADYHFIILESDRPNVFSHPGGYVYVSRNLLEMIPEDEPNALEFAIGHEIAHLERKHALASINSPGVRRYTDGTLTKFYFLIIPHAYIDAHEFEADERVYLWMGQLHRSNFEIMAFLRKLERYADVHKLDKRRQPNPAVDLSLIENHLRAKTIPSDRLAHLKEFRDELSKKAK
jgi:hypothetical protein